MNWLIILGIILFIILIIIFKIKYDYDLLKISLIILGVIFMMLILFVIFRLIITYPEKVLIEKENYGGTFDLHTISSVLPERIFGERIGLPLDLVYHLIYLFDPKSAVNAVNLDIKSKKSQLDKAIEKNDTPYKYDLEEEFSVITVEDEIGVIKAQIRRSQDILAFYSQNLEEINMFSLTEYYNISVEKDKLMILEPKIKINDSDGFSIKKYVMMKALHTSDFSVLKDYEIIKDEKSYDFLCMLAKEPPSIDSDGHFVIVIIRKRNNEIKINLLDPLLKENNHKLVFPIRDTFIKFFGLNKNYNIEYINNYCGQQVRFDTSNCGFYSYKFIYNYLLLSYDNDDIRVIKYICPGRKEDTFFESWYNRTKILYTGPANTVLKSEKQQIKYKVDDCIKTKNFYYITEKERDFILKLIDV